MKRRIIEIAKDILIVLLICSLLLLTLMVIPEQTIRSVPWLSRLVQPLAPVLGYSDTELTTSVKSTVVSDGAGPIAISVKNAAGRHTALWDFAQLDEDLEVFTPIVTKAMEQAQQFRAVSPGQLNAALGQSGVYLHYADSQPISVLSSWFDTSLPATLPDMEGCALVVQNDAIVLYLIGEDSYASDTGISSEELLPVLNQFEPDGSVFAFETTYALDPLSLLPAEGSTVPAVTRSNPCDARYTEDLATALGFNPYGEGRYLDDHGTLSFSETGTSLTVTADGLITYKDQTSHFTAKMSDPADPARCARQFVDLLLDNVSGEGRLYLSSVKQDGTTVICSFDYFICGVPVDLPQSPVVVTISNGAITEASAQLHAFIPTGKEIHPLPTAQAAALLPAGYPLELIYQFMADGSLSAGWHR